MKYQKTKDTVDSILTSLQGDKLEMKLSLQFYWLKHSDTFEMTPSKKKNFILYLKHW